MNFNGVNVSYPLMRVYVQTASENVNASTVSVFWKAYRLCVVNETGQKNMNQYLFRSSEYTTASKCDYKHHGTVIYNMFFTNVAVENNVTVTISLDKSSTTYKKVLTTEESFHDMWCQTLNYLFCQSDTFKIS